MVALSHMDHICYPFEVGAIYNLCKLSGYMFSIKFLNRMMSIFVLRNNSIKNLLKIYKHEQIKAVRLIVSLNKVELEFVSK